MDITGPVGLLHPGEMGAAIGACLRTAGVEVRWASAGRGEATRARADAAGFTDVVEPAAVLAECATVLSVCPPHAALDVAALAAGYTGVYVDANAIAPESASRAATTVGPAATFVDGGIVGPPPERAGTTRLFLSGPAAAAVSELFEDTHVEALVVGDQIGAASAVKVAYAAWTKGSQALLLATAAYAERSGVTVPLREEWERSQPALPERLTQAERAAVEKGWRWTGEMHEIAAALRAAGLPDGFHQAAAEIYGTDRS